MKRNQLTAIILAVVIICLAVPHTYAIPTGNEPIGIQPFWVNTDDVYVILTFSGTTANCYASVTGLTGTTKVEATVTLEKKTGSTYVVVKSWPKQSVNSTSYEFYNTHGIDKGNTYRLTINASVTRNGKVESVSVYQETSV